MGFGIGLTAITRCYVGLLEGSIGDISFCGGCMALELRGFRGCLCGPVLGIIVSN